MISINIVNPSKTSVQHSGLNNGYYEPNSNVANNVPFMYRMLSVFYAILITFGSLLLEEKKHDNFEKEIDNYELNVYQNQNQNIENNIIDNTNFMEVSQFESEDDDKIPSRLSLSSIPSFQKNNEFHEIGPWELIHIPLAYYVASCFIMTTFGGMYIAGTFKTFGQEIILNESYLSTISSVSSIFNCLGRIFWGELADRIGLVQTLIIMSFLFSIIIFTYSYTLLINQYIFTLWTFMIFFCEGANFALYPPLISQLFGNKNMSSNYGIIFGIYSLFVVTLFMFISHFQINFIIVTKYLAGITFLGFINLLILSKNIPLIIKSK